MFRGIVCAALSFENDEHCMFRARFLSRKLMDSLCIQIYTIKSCKIIITSFQLGNPVSLTTSPIFSCIPKGRSKDRNEAREARSGASAVLGRSQWCGCCVQPRYRGALTVTIGCCIMLQYDPEPKNIFKNYWRPLMMWLLDVVGPQSSESSWVLYMRNLL